MFWFLQNRKLLRELVTIVFFAILFCAIALRCRVIICTVSDYRELIDFNEANDVQHTDNFAAS
jgi:hypothetical protein